MNKNTQTQTGGGNAPRVPLSEINKLEKRMGARIWDGVFYNRDGISNPHLTILSNDAGREIMELLKLEA